MRTWLPATVSAMLLVAGLSVPVQAQLLTSITDTVTETVGSVTDTVGDTVDSLTGGGGGGSGSGGGVLGLGGGEAGDDAVVNVGVGGKGNVVDVRLGKGGDPLAKVNVGIGSNLTAGLDLLGLGLDLSVSGVGDLLGGGGQGGGNPGNGPGNGNVRVGSLGGANALLVKCSVEDGRKVLQLAAAGKVDRRALASWQRAANVRIVPVKLCPAARSQVAKLFGASKKVRLLQVAASRDALIAASLSRTRYDAGDVFAVQAQNGQLAVYVY